MRARGYLTIFLWATTCCAAEAETLAIRCTQEKLPLDVNVVLTEGPYKYIDRGNISILPKVQQVSVHDNGTQKWINVRDIVVDSIKDQIYTVRDPSGIYAYGAPGAYYLLITRSNGSFIWRSQQTRGDAITGTCNKIAFYEPPERPDPVIVPPPQNKF